jgi:hypothetical protein
MMDDELARMRSHRNNIIRLRRLLKTRLTQHERQLIYKSVSEEQLALDALRAATLFEPSQNLIGCLMTSARPWAGAA